MAESKPRILIVDDDIEIQRHAASALRTQGLLVDLRQPNEVQEADISAADVIAVDQIYKWDMLPHPTEPAYWPWDGLAIAAVLAGQMRKIGTHAAIVLRTGALSQLASGLPEGVRTPVLAAQNSLDWVLVKGDDSEGRKLVDIAKAIHDLGRLIADKASWDDGRAWLALPDTSWHESALVDVQVCRPPEHAVAAYTSGGAWVRWFAHRILPYPTFLLSDSRTATSLRLEGDEFAQLLEQDSEFSRRLRQCVYTGHLASLVERRWWRAGIDELLDELLTSADPESDESDALVKAYSKMAGRDVSTITVDRPVTVVDADYHDYGVADAGDCVRLAPDLWPVYADDPWARIDDVVEDPELAALVSRGDRNRIREGR